MLGLMQDRPLLISQMIDFAAPYHPRRRDRLAHGRGRHPSLRLSRRAQARQAGRRGAAGPGHQARATASAPWPGTATAISSSTSASPASARCCTPSTRGWRPSSRLHRQPRRRPDHLRRPQPAADRREACCAQLKTVQPRRGHDRPRAHAGRRKIPNLLCYEELIADKPGTLRRGPTSTRSTASSLCYTSGTTGNPKGVLYSHRSTVLHAYDDALARRARPLAARSPSCRWCRCSTPTPGACPTPRRSSAPSWSSPASQLDGASLYELFDKEKVTFTAGVPTVWLALLDYCRPTSSSSRRSSAP